MHSTKSHGGKISQLLALTVIVMLAISCGPKNVENNILNKSGTWEITKYQVFNHHTRLWIAEANGDMGLYRNYDSMGQLQFNDNETAIFTYDSIAVPFTWKDTTEQSNVSDVIYDVLHLAAADTPTGNAIRIPFLKNNINCKVNTFRILTMEKNFIYMRYRTRFNYGTNDTVGSVDIYLKRQ